MAVSFFTMPKIVPSFLKDILTGIDGESYDMGRAIGVAAGVCYLIMGFIGLHKSTANHPFDYQAFGIGFGSLVTGIAILLKAKEKSEPSQGSPNAQ